MCKAVEMTRVQCESLRQELHWKNSELDEKFAQLADARIARDKEDFMAYNESLEEKLRSTRGPSRRCEAGRS